MASSLNSRSTAPLTASNTCTRVALCSSSSRESWATGTVGPAEPEAVADAPTVESPLSDWDSLEKSGWVSWVTSGWMSRNISSKRTFRETFSPLYTVMTLRSWQTAQNSPKSEKNKSVTANGPSAADSSMLALKPPLLCFPGLPTGSSSDPNGASVCWSPWSPFRDSDASETTLSSSSTSARRPPAFPENSRCWLMASRMSTPRTEWAGPPCCPSPSSASSPALHSGFLARREHLTITNLPLL
mmetsp:Transcript_30026/g.66462  ORF Transcript_30026/g.66462 Transcript_30026/m.66462 type:complete len:243 (-) Transcript_30026:188-916(-)